MRGTMRKTANETILIGLKCDPNQCPKCADGLLIEYVDLNLYESKCRCGYRVRDRVGSLRSAEEILDAQPGIVILHSDSAGTWVVR